MRNRKWKVSCETHFLTHESAAGFRELTGIVYQQFGWNKVTVILIPHRYEANRMQWILGVNRSIISMDIGDWDWISKDRAMDV